MIQDNYIVVDGASLKELTIYVTELLVMYGEDIEVEPVNIFASQTTLKQHIITFSVKPNFETFRYIVNFLRYPVTNEKPANDHNVIGYYTAREDVDQKGQVVGKRWMIYVPENDTEFDMVYGIYQGAKSTIKFPFDLPVRLEELSFKQYDFVEPHLNFQDQEPITTVSKPQGVKKTRLGCAGIFVVALTLVIGFTLTFF